MKHTIGKTRRYVWCIAFVVLLRIVSTATSPLGLDGTDIIFHIKGPDTNAAFGRFSLCPLGDINGDGYDDIAFDAYVPDSSVVFYGGAPPDTVFDLYLRGRVWAVDDFDGDGFRDMITSKNYFSSVRDSCVVYMYRGFADSIGSLPYDSLWSLSANQGRGEVVRVGNANHDGFADFLLLQNRGPDSPRIFYYQGSGGFDTISEWSVGTSGPSSHYLRDWGNFGFVDFNGDGWRDIFVGFQGDLDSTSFVGIYYGPTFGVDPDQVLAEPTETRFSDSLYYNFKTFTNFVRCVGDIDGDSFEELAVSYGSYMLLYSGGPFADTLIDYVIDMRCGTVASIGDVNGDGSSDLALGESYRAAQGGVEVLLGGVLWDEYSDGHLIRVDLPPYFLQRIGWQVSGAGDFNGDGFEDILFSSDNFSLDNVGDVFVAKGGSDIVTGMRDVEFSMPVQVTLHPNFPNPFNPSTTISFDLPRRSQVTLAIVNTLGQEVARLVNGEVAAGTHSIEWDGRGESGEVVASGVYLYRLETEDGVLSRKMLLLK